MLARPGIILMCAAALLPGLALYFYIPWARGRSGLPALRASMHKREQSVFLRGAVFMPDVPLEFEVVFEPEDEGGFHVYAPALKGCHSYGVTKEEARHHIAEAIQLWLDSARESGLAIPDRETVQVTT